MKRQYRIVTGVCVLLMLAAAVIGPVVAIRVLDSSDASRARASARITSLQEQLTELNARLDASSADRASLHTAVDALSTQIRQMGGQPIAAAAPTVTTTTTVPKTTTTSTTRKPTGVTLPVSVPHLG